MFTSLRLRLWLTYVTLVIGVLGIVAVGLVLYLLQNPARQTIPRLLDTADRLHQRGNLFIEARLPDALQRADMITGYRLLLIQPDGTQIDSRRESDGTSSFPALHQTSALRATAQVRDSHGQTWLYTTRVLENQSILVVATPLVRVPIRQIFRDDILPPVFLAGVIALLSALVLAYWISRWVAAPLGRMAAAAQSLASGQPQVILLEGPMEVQSLAKSLNDMSAQVQASQRSQRDFVANVSHELKTPLTSIQGFAQAIVEDAADTPEARKQAASIIYEEAGRMNRLVRDLLDLARLDSGIAEFKRQPVELAGLLRKVTDKFSPQARLAQVELRLDSHFEGLIVGDADRLEQVFTNLVDNAILHTPAGGLVTLNAHPVQGYVEIAVTDSGKGIPPEALPRIFERFFQVEKSRQRQSGHGVGLGLTISREIILAHHGKISAQNSPSGGGLFVVKLPITMPDDSTIVKKHRQAHPR